MKKHAVPGKLWLLLAFFAASVHPIQASVITWTNTLGGNWSSPTNWSPNQLPGAADTANITVTATNSYGVTLDVSPTVAGLVLGASSGATTQSFSTGSQTLTVNGAIQVNSQGQFNLNGGALAGTNVLVGKMNCSGGTLTGTLTVSNNSLLNISTSSGGTVTFKTLTLTNNGTVNWTNTSIYGGLTTQIYNYGLWNAQSDNTLYGANIGFPVTIFDNFGTFLKSGNTGTTTLDGNTVFNNSGALNVASGTLALAGGGASSSGAAFTTSPGANLNFTGAYIFSNAAALQGSGGVVMSSGATLNGVITYTNLFLTGGTFGGTNVLVGTMNCSGGTLSGTMTVSNNSLLNISSSSGGTVTFKSLTLTNNGTVNWTNTSIYSGLTTQIYNYGLWNAQSDNTVYGANIGFPVTIFDNFGTFLKSGNAGTTTLDGNTVFNNSGAVNMASGTLAVAGGGASSGSATFSPAPGANLDFNNAYTFSNAAALQGGGNVVMTSGATLNGVIGYTNLFLTGGTFGGTNVLVGTINCSGGTLSGTLTVSNNSLLNIASSGATVTFKSLTLTNNGTVNWTNTSIYSGLTTQIYNYGLWNSQSDNTIYGANVGFPVTIFDNFGTFLKSGNAGTTTLDGNTVFNNSGTVNVASGTLAVVGGGASSSSAAFSTAAAANLNFTSAYIFSNAAALQGSGGVVMSSGATLNGVITYTNLFLTGGTFGGTNVLVGTINCSGGTLSGTLTVSNNSLLNIASSGATVTLKSWTLTNNGTVNWTNTSLYSGLTTQIYNYGLWNAQSDNTIYGANIGFPVTIFDNFGTFLKSGNAGTTTLDGNTVFNNSGAVNVASGTLALAGGGASSSGAAFSTAPGANLNFTSAYIFSNAAALQGSGGVVMSSGATLNGVITYTNLFLTGGIFGGTNVLVGTMNCSGGTLSGVMTVSNNSLLNIASSASTVTFKTLTLSNNGTVNWTNTSIYSGLATQIYNYGLWNAQSDNTVYGANIGFPATIFDNFGTFLKSGNTGTTTLDGNTVFTNMGTISVQSGSLTLNTYNLANGTLKFGISGLTNFGTMTLAGNASLAGALSANLIGNYVPLVSNAFQVLNFSSFSGAFTGTNLPPYAVWQTTNNPTNVTIKVLKLVPQLAWTNPASIVYGTLLSSAQLGATAASPTNLSGALAGTFNYTPASGALLQSGSNQTLSATFVPADQANYTNVTTNVSINVLRAPLSVTAGSQSKTYGLNLSLGTTAFTTTVLSNSDTVTGVTLSSPGATGTATVARSPYSITASVAVGTGLTNYNITYQSGNLTVNPAPLTITANSQSKTYGQIVNLASTAFTTTVLSNSDTVTGVNLASAGAPTAATVAGSPYPITASAAVGTGLANYSIIYQAGTLTVNPAPLTITAGNQSKTYGQTLVLGTTNFTATVLSNSDTLTGVTLSSPGAVATATVTGSPYAITPSAALGTGLANYNITYLNGHLTINPVAVTIGSGLTANSKYYDNTTTATLTSNNVVLLGVLTGDTASLSTNGYVANFASAGVGSGVAVTVSGLTLSGASAGNYTLTQPVGLTASIIAPGLQIAANLPNVVISWPAAASVFVLNQTASLASPITWSPVTNSISVNGTNNTVTINAGASGGHYFELIGP